MYIDNMKSVTLGTGKCYKSGLNRQLFFSDCLEKEMATHWCSCLENPRKGGTWWAAVSGVAQSQTQLKRLRSSSSRVRLKKVVGKKKKKKVVEKSSIMQIKLMHVSSL